MLKRSRSSKNKPSSLAINRVDALINTLHAEGRIDSLEQELRRLEASSLSRDEQISWWQAWGIAALRQGRRDEALKRFESGYHQFPDSAHIRFSLGQQYVLAGAVERGFELLRMCRFPEVPREYTLAQARLAYLWNRFEEGLNFLQPFFDVFRQVRILDDHFLYVRGLPFFGQAWGYLAALMIVSGRIEALQTQTRWFIKNCSDYDFEYLETAVRAYCDDRPDLLREIWERSCSEQASGHACLNAAIIRARAAETLAAAQTILAQVVFDEHDFPWVEDARVLALAEAAHRHGDDIGEREYVTQFMARQPMLLEPDVALMFHLLRYQETLKPNVWQAAQAARV
ncbi:MAG: hypothetical protein RMN25_07515 [Anaerolineae bacterium]|nr:hypothetical protein [Thermoflexales bacterium]MDW8407618.1 hypothetical protein [Anaerolineae bacterium]